MLSKDILLSLKNHLLNITTGFFPHLHIQSPQISISYTLIFSDFLQSQLIVISHACSPRSHAQEKLINISLFFPLILFSDPYKIENCHRLKSFQDILSS